MLVAAAVTALVLSGTVGSAAARPAAAAASVLTTNLPSGAPGSAFTLHGTGFGPAETVAVTFDGAVASTPSTADDGSFTTTVGVPAAAIPGIHSVIATGQSSGTTQSTQYTVMATWQQLLGSPIGRDNTAENVLDPATAATLNQDWATPVGGAVGSSPIMRNGQVYVGSADGSLRDVSAASGQVVWTAATGGPISSSPAFASGNIYIGSADGKLYAFAASNGSPRWSVQTGGPISSSPTVAGGVLYVGSADGYLYAFTATNGALRWKAKTGAAVTSSPNKVGTLVYVGSGNGNLEAFNAGNGGLRWSRATGGAIASSPDIVGGVIYVGSGDTNVYALNASTGAVLWTASTGGAVNAVPAVADGVVYVGSADGNVYALNASDGTTRWTATTGGPVSSSAAVADGVVYVGSGDGNLYAYPTTCTGSCSPIWTGTTGAAVASSPVVTNGQVFVGSNDGNLYAFTPASDPAVDSAAYLGDPGHSSYNAAATAITPANAAAMVQSWHWLADAPPIPSLTAGLFASPVVYQHHIYFGANNGIFYALDDRTGALLWKKFIGYVTATTCGSRGFLSTATIAADPTTGQPTIYVAGPDGYLYAMSPVDGSVLWRSVIAIPSTTQNDYFNWSSPTVANGKIYVGVASQCDEPLVRGGEKSYDQGTGAPIATYWAIQQGLVGATIWSSAAVAPDGSVFVTTGNQADGATAKQFGDSLSIVHLDGQTLNKIGIYTVPHSQQCGDCDFGGSPTLFSATVNGTPTDLVGACNKNGNYYAVKQSDMSLVWSQHIGARSSNENNQQCDAAAIWDGSRLFIAGDQTVVNGLNYGGSVRQVDPATGAIIWITGTPAAILGSPSMDGAGVIAAISYDYSGALNSGYLIDASTGQLLSTLSTQKSTAFPQPVFADDEILLGTSKNGLYAYRPAD
jgi:outer membrane protein assembly factor BamB